MVQKMENINCCFFDKGVCHHRAAPIKWFASARCLWTTHSSDARVPKGCGVQQPYPRPTAPITPPPRKP